MKPEARFRDFDAAFAELGEIEFVVNGVTYNVGHGPPAARILKAIRDGEVREDNPEQMVRIVLGDEITDKILDGGISVPMLTELSEWLLLQIDMRPPGEGEGAAEGKVSTPKRSSSRSR